MFEIHFRKSERCLVLFTEFVFPVNFSSSSVVSIKICKAKEKSRKTRYSSKIFLASSFSNFFPVNRANLPARFIRFENIHGLPTYAHTLYRTLGELAPLFDSRNSCSSHRSSLCFENGRVETESRKYLSCLYAFFFSVQTISRIGTGRQPKG